MIQMQEKESYRIRSGSGKKVRATHTEHDSAGPATDAHELERVSSGAVMTPCTTSLAQHIQGRPTASPRESVGSLGPELAKGLEEDIKLKNGRDSLEPQTPHAAVLVGVAMRRQLAQEGADV